MTVHPIILSTDLYRRLERSAQQRGVDPQTLAQTLLAQQLEGETATELPLYLQLLPQIRELVARQTATAPAPLATAAASDVVALRESWNAAEPADDDAGWEDVLREIDANRLSSRKLFADRDPVAQDTM